MTGYTLKLKNPGRVPKNGADAMTKRRHQAKRNLADAHTGRSSKWSLQERRDSVRQPKNVCAELERFRRPRSRGETASNNATS